MHEEHQHDRYAAVTEAEATSEASTNAAMGAAIRQAAGRTYEPSDTLTRLDANLASAKASGSEQAITEANAALDRFAAQARGDAEGAGAAADESFSARIRREARGIRF